MKILVLRLSSLGDIVLTQPVVQRLHDVFPEAELHFMVKEQYKDIPQQFGVPLQVISYSKSAGFHFSLLRAKYDIVFDLHAKLSTILVRLFCLGAQKFAYDKQRRLREQIVRHKTDQSLNSTLDLYRTALQKAAKGLNELALEEPLSSPLLHLSEHSIESMRSKLSLPADKKLIALFPGATHNTKRYPREYFTRMIQMANDNLHFLLMGSEGDMGITHRIHADTLHRSTDFGGKFSIRESMQVIALSDAVITNDSGPMHLAAALGKSQIAVFGATHPRLGFRPLNAKAVILCKNVICQPCSLHGGKLCPRKHFACMLSIEPTQILDELSKLI